MTLFGQLDTRWTPLSIKIDSGGTFSPLKGAALNRFSAEAKHGKFGTSFSSKTFEHKYTNHTSFASKHLYRV